MKTHRPIGKELLAEIPVQTEWFPDEEEVFGSLNKPSLLSRWTCGKNDFDDLSNLMSFGRFLQQTPASNINIATLAATASWITAQPLNQATYLSCLFSNGQIYQALLAGAITNISRSP